jgi:hypothetical protein
MKDFVIIFCCQKWPHVLIKFPFTTFERWKQMTIIYDYHFHKLRVFLCISILYSYKPITCWICCVINQKIRYRPRRNRIIETCLKTSGIRLLMWRIGICFLRILLRSLWIGWQVVTMGTLSVWDLSLYWRRDCRSCRGLYFGRIISSVSEALFDISLFLEAGRGRADAADADGQTFRYTFESMGWMTARWHETQIGVHECSV